VKSRARPGESYDAAAGRERAAIPAGRFGAPAEFGAACAFLCGNHAGFITGQNVLLDGGKFPGTL
ncbi:MAG: SDR family oxidoreductase, partial [Alphaproteobacteria bacterium]